MTENLERGWKPGDVPSPFFVRAADRLFHVVADQIKRGRIDARSEIGDAALDYREERDSMARRDGTPPVHDRKQMIQIVDERLRNFTPSRRWDMGGSREKAGRIVDALLSQPDPEVDIEGLWACAIGEDDHDPRCTGECGPCGGIGGVEAMACLTCGGDGKCRGCSIGYRLRRALAEVSELRLAEERLREVERERDEARAQTRKYSGELDELTDESEVILDVIQEVVREWDERGDGKVRKSVEDRLRAVLSSLPEPGAEPDA